MEKWTKEKKLTIAMYSVVPFVIVGVIMYPLSYYTEDVFISNVFYAVGPLIGGGACAIILLIRSRIKKIRQKNMMNGEKGNEKTIKAGTRTE